MSDDLDKLLKQLLGSDSKKKDDDDEDGDNETVPATEQKALLEGLMEKSVDLKVGDYIKRNKYGKKRYMWPKEDEVAMITALYPPNTLNCSGSSADLVHGEMTTVKTKNGKAHLISCSINFRYYDKVSAAPKIREDDDE